VKFSFPSPLRATPFFTAKPKASPNARSRSTSPFPVSLWSKCFLVDKLPFFHLSSPLSGGSLPFLHPFQPNTSAIPFSLFPSLPPFFLLVRNQRSFPFFFTKAGKGGLPGANMGGTPFSLLKAPSFLPSTLWGSVEQTFPLSLPGSSAGTHLLNFPITAE